MGKHIVFDCDGTLISSQMAIYQSIQYMLSHYYQKEYTIEDIQKVYSADPMEFIPKLGIDVSTPEGMKKLSDSWIETCATNDFKYALFDGIEDLLKDLSANGHTLYVWTGRDRRSTLAILKELGIISYFLDFRCLDDTTPKPHPQGLEELVGDYDRSDIVVIGDSFTDIQGANSFGCESIAALWCEHANHLALEREGATFKAHSPTECLRVIENKFR